MKAAPKPPADAETVEMADGRIFWSYDNWHTIYVTRRGSGGRSHIVRGKDEADFVRFLAITQASAGPS